MRYKHTRRSRGIGAKIKAFAPVNIDNAAANCAMLFTRYAAIGRFIVLLLKTLLRDIKLSIIFAAYTDSLVLKRFMDVDYTWGKADSSFVGGVCAVLYF